MQKIYSMQVFCLFTLRAYRALNLFELLSVYGNGGQYIYFWWKHCMNNARAKCAWLSEWSTASVSVPKQSSVCTARLFSNAFLPYYIFWLRFLRNRLSLSLSPQLPLSLSLSLSRSLSSFITIFTTFLQT